MTKRTTRTTKRKVAAVVPTPRPRVTRRKLADAFSAESQHNALSDADQDINVGSNESKNADAASEGDSSDSEHESAYDSDDEAYEFEGILDERPKEVLVNWKGVGENGKPWEPTWEPKKKEYAIALAAFRDAREKKTKSVAQSNPSKVNGTADGPTSATLPPLLAVEPRAKTGVSASACILCANNEGVGRKCAKCGEPLHHFCSDELREQLGIDESAFGDSCYCSSTCFEFNTGQVTSSRPRNPAKAKRMTATLSSSQVAIAKRSTKECSGSDGGKKDGLEAGADKRPGRELTRDEIVESRRRVAFSPGKETEWMLPASAYKDVESEFVFGVVVKPMQRKSNDDTEGGAKPKKSGKKRDEVATHPDLLDTS